MNRIGKWFSNFWARRKWAIVTILALCVILPTSWAVLPKAQKIEILRTFGKMWNGLTSTWETKWTEILETLGIKSKVLSGSHIPCSDDDICSMAINRSFKPITLSDLKAVMGNKNIEAMIIDIRSVEEYEKGHIPEALSIPVDDLRQYLAGVPRSTPLILIGNGDENYKEIGEQLVDRWIFSNASFLVGGMKAWDGELQREK